MFFELAGRLNPKRVCEIGVRAGYSAFTVLSANPDAHVLGIEANLDHEKEDAHGGQKGFYRHALQILEPFDFELLLVNSHDIKLLPRFDLIYVDGDHSFNGCLSDLELVEKSTDQILVDDYESIAPVREACHEFLKTRPEFVAERIENGLTGFLLLHRENQVANEPTDHQQ